MARAVQEQRLRAIRSDAASGSIIRGSAIAGVSTGNFRRLTAEALDAHTVGNALPGAQLIDNLNASIHLRALLADLFLVAEIFEARERQTKAANGTA